jgi:hypothetical protein
MFVGAYSIEEAEDFALNQLGVSACGATAVIASLLLLKLLRKDDITPDDMNLCLERRMR